MGTWTARNKTSGLIPNSSDNVAIGALNTTTGVVWNLPSAVRRGWVTQSDADAWMGQLVTSLNTNRNQTTYLPTRFLDLVTAAPGDRSRRVEHRRVVHRAGAAQLQVATDDPAALSASIDALENRFDFAAFAGSGRLQASLFSTHRPIRLLHLQRLHQREQSDRAGRRVVDDHNVPLASMWNKDTGRLLASLTDPSQNYLVYSNGTGISGSIRAGAVEYFRRHFRPRRGQLSDSHSSPAIRGRISSATKRTSRPSCSSSAAPISSSPMPEAARTTLTIPGVSTTTSASRMCFNRGA